MTIDQLLKTYRQQQSVAGDSVENDNVDDLVGRECIALGQWMHVEASYSGGELTCIDQEGGDHQITTGDVQHWY